MRYFKLRGNTEALIQRPQWRAKLNTVAEIPDKRRALRDVPDIWMRVTQKQQFDDQKTTRSDGAGITRVGRNKCHMQSKYEPSPPIQ